MLKKLGIEALNPMQIDAQKTIIESSETVLLSSTGTGKTLAFLLPILDTLDPESNQIQALILVPSRELAIQIEQVIREMGSGFKTNAVYGGRPGSKEKMDLKHPPAILVGTPGRVSDHIKRNTFTTESIKTLVLDEFDKSLEVGFEKEMKAILKALGSIEKKILTSATQGVEIPNFIGIRRPKKLNYLGESSALLTLKTVESPTKDKLETLAKLIAHIGEGNGIIFCNYKETIQFVSDFLIKNKISHGCFYGGMEQIDRERSLIKFRNGTHRILIATDLAARGIDVPEMDFIIHFQLPPRAEEFTHRNGRTARMHQAGVAYVLKWEEVDLPSFIKDSQVEILQEKPIIEESNWETLYITGGRKDNISKGDIAGLFFKQGNLTKDELGIIELKQECSFVAVPKSKAKELLKTLSSSRLKKKKVRISLVE